MIDYSQLSDFEINNLVALAIGSKVTDSYRVGDERETIYYSLGEDEFCVKRGYGSFVSQFDPCNNPADAWPIIVGHKLSLINADDEWLCVPDDTVIDGVTGDDVQMIYSSGGHVHANPLRAAMIVFLMMQEKSK